MPPLVLLFRLCSLERNGFNPPTLSNAEWDQLAKLAVAHGVGAWLLDRLLADYPDLPLPDGSRSLLLAAAHANLSQCAVMTGVVLRITSLLRNEGIEPIFLKGLALLRDFYPDIALRSTSDVDILVTDPDNFRARDALVADGAAPCHQRPEVIDKFRNHMVPMRYRGLSVEIHRNLSRHDVGRVSPIINIESHVAKSDDFSSLDAEASFCHLAIHAASHRRREMVCLKWYVDLAVVIMSRPADPLGFINRCLEVAPSARSDIREAVAIAMPLLPANVASLFAANGFTPVKLALADIDPTSSPLWPIRKSAYKAFSLALAVVELLRRGQDLLPSIRYFAHLRNNS